ncbi:unnamed protein product [Aphanomyces euteiches]
MPPVQSTLGKAPVSKVAVSQTPRFKSDTAFPENYASSKQQRIFHPPDIVYEKPNIRNTIQDTVAQSHVKYGAMTSNAQRLVSTAAMVHNVVGAPKLRGTTTAALGPGTYSDERFARAPPPKKTSLSFAAILPSEARVVRSLAALMSADEGDGVDFDYLMALIHNTVGPSTTGKDIVSSISALDEGDSRYNIPAAYMYEDDESSCEEGEIAVRTLDEEDGETDRNESFPTDQQADPAPTMIIRPLSPDCLSPQTHINRIIGPRYEMFEPVRPQQLRRMPLPPRYLPPQSENVGFSGRRPEIISKRPLTLGSSSRCEERNPKHPVPAPLHQHDILSDESDHGANVNDIHDSISSDEEEEIGNQVEVEEIDIPDLQMSLLSHLVDMGFEATIALPALHDAYIDINDGNNEQHDDLNMFLALVKAVSDAHDEEGISKPSSSFMSLKSIMKTVQQDNTFPWPVFDMAQYEFGTARPGTCFGCVIVLVNLPRVTRGAEFDALHNLFLVQIFSMLSNPIQVILPFAPNATSIKGHGFVEFQNRQQATLAARILDGLRWSLAAPPIRAMLFREYHGSHGKDGDTETENLTLHAMDLISEDEEGDVEIAGQLNQRNEHLEYLIHYIEQDRNAVLLENEELKSMLDKYRLREQQQEEAMLSLSSLRKRIQVNEHKHREHMKRMRQNEHVIETLRRRLQELTG